MSDLVTDPKDQRLGHGGDVTPGPQNAAYLVLSEEERAKGFVKPYRESYRHRTCGTSTRMSPAIAETYARNPWFYGATYCVACRMHRPLAEFTWEPDGESMSPHDPGWKQPEAQTP
jgi:hypothetical protein